VRLGEALAAWPSWQLGPVEQKTGQPWQLGFQVKKGKGKGFFPFYFFLYSPNQFSNEFLNPFKFRSKPHSTTK
jgi:hypothetical protein